MKGLEIKITHFEHMSRQVFSKQVRGAVQGSLELQVTCGALQATRESPTSPSRHLHAI